MTIWWRFLYLFRTNDPQWHCNAFFWQSWNNFLHGSLMIFWWFFLSFSRYNDPQCHCNDFWIIIFFHFLTTFDDFFFSTTKWFCWQFFDNFLTMFFSFSRSNDAQCHCNDGFGGPDCSQPDVNECKYRPCSIHAECTNTLGSFTCACREGKKHIIRKYYDNTGCWVFKSGVQN